MQLAHARDDGLTGLVIRGNTERRVFFSELLECDGHLVLLSLGLRLDRDVDDRISEFHGLEDDRCVLVAQRVARGGVL